MRIFVAFLLLAWTSASARVLTDADLAPISLGEADREARGLIAQKRWAEAAQKITATSPEARLVSGWLLQHAGKSAKAIDVLDGVDAALPLLADLVRSIRGQALLKMERFEEALAASQGTSTTPAGHMIRRVRARALRELGRLSDARTAYTAIIATKVASEVPVGLLGFARLEKAANQTVTAIALLRRLDLEYPAHWAAKAGRRLAKSIILKDPSLSDPWSHRSTEETLSRGERLLKRHQNKAVVQGLTPLLDVELTDEQRCRHRYSLGKAHRKMRQWKTAKPLLYEAVEVCIKAQHERAPWAIHLAGKAADRLGEEKRSAAFFRMQMARYPTHRLADDGGYHIINHLLDDKKDFKAARKALSRLVEKFPHGDMVGDAIFHVAEVAIRKKKYKTARQVLALDDTLPPRDFKDHDGGRTLYWRARLDQLTKRVKQAQAGYRSTIASYPMGWYALMAYSRLYDLDPKDARDTATKALTTIGPGPTLPGGDTAEWSFTVPEGADQAALDRAILLARIGLASEAQSALKKAKLKDNRGTLWLTAWILDRASAYNYSHDILRRKLPEFRHFTPHGFLKKHWQIAYPDPYSALAQTVAKAAGIDANWVRAVIREESGFNPAIESFANAMGLMQLIMSTARSMATADEKPIDRAKLSNPELNMKLGARYLARVQKKSKSNWALVPAGYNAGGGALRRWLKSRGTLDLDLFVELIPYDEARGYTKRVVASWATYRMLYGAKGIDPLPYLSQKTKVP